MPFFKKADEMEMAINFRAMRLAWVVENLILAVWIIWGIVTGSDRDFQIPFLVISVQNVLFFGAKLHMTRRMARGGDEE